MMTDTVSQQPPAATGSTDEPRAGSSSAVASRIEIGLIYTGKPRDAAFSRMEQTRDRLLQNLSAAFPEYRWILTVRCRDRRSTEARIEPTDLLQLGSEERDAHEWDFAIVVTPRDLVSHYHQFSLAVVSRSLDLAVVSLSRLNAGEQSNGQHDEDLESRLQRLILHVLGHLNGLSDDDDRANVMFHPADADDLAEPAGFADSQIESLRKNLQQIADLRLEEQEDAERSYLWSFYLRSMWINRHEIVDALWQARPWEFPIRLARLTAAAVSSALLLLITAETWDVALNQSPGAVGLLISFALLLTTGFVVKRQHLLVSRRKRRVTEQAVIANVAAVGIVFIGMATTAVLLFSLALAAGVSLFPPELVESWAASAHVSCDFPCYLQMATFVASIGILIGSLGASFEEQHHFRHIVLVDEEV